MHGGGRCAKYVSKVAVCPHNCGCTDKGQGQGCGILSREGAEGNAHGVICYVKRTVKVALVAVEYLSYIDRTLWLVVPPCGVVKAPLFDIDHRVGQFYLLKVGQGVICVKIVNMGGTAFYNQLCQLGAVEVYLWLKESVTDGSILGKGKGYALATCTRIVEDIVVYSKVGGLGAGIIYALKTGTLVKCGVSKACNIAENAQALHTGAPAKAGFAKANNTLV